MNSANSVSVAAQNQPEMLLVRAAQVFTPQDAGKQDILACGRQIIRIAPRIDPPPNLKVRIIDASGKLVIPGLVDLHVHLIGGGGEGGFATRTPEIDSDTILKAGVTTVAGCLGTDDVTRSLESLFAKAMQLRSSGISAFIYTGSYHVPPPTITGSIRRDIALLEPVIGVGEIAISDHRSSHPSFEEFIRMASEARTGGMIGGKAGLVHLHLGNGRDRLALLMRAVKETEIPIGQFLPTHVNRSPELFQHALEFARLGGNIDLTAGAEALEFALAPAKAIKQAIKAGINLNRITISSDSNGSMPVFDAQGNLVRLAVGKIERLLKELQAVQASGLALEKALCLFTQNPARRLGLDKRKGHLAPGMDADLVICNPGLQVEKVISRGKLRLS